MITQTSRAGSCAVRSSSGLGSKQSALFSGRFLWAVALPLCPRNPPMALGRRPDVCTLTPRALPLVGTPIGHLSHTCLCLMAGTRQSQVQAVTVELGPGRERRSETQNQKRCLWTGSEVEPPFQTGAPHRGAVGMSVLYPTCPGSGPRGRAGGRG